MEHKFPYRWTLKDADFTKDKGTVFSCFACGGGSTMGYKLAGLDVIGDNEIDPRMNKLYVKNHHPKFNYLCDIRELVTQASEHELPDNLYNLDILDCSFPCTSFSFAGNRDKDWGKEKQFKEGQVSQVLDTLAFDSINLVNALRPKVVVFENVKGLICGKAKVYTDKIVEELDKIGYTCNYWLLNGRKMGLPQSRERVFFISVRKDYGQEKGLFAEDGTIKINMEFNEPDIPYGEIADDICNPDCIKQGGKMREYWDNRKEGDKSCADVCERLYGKRSCFSNKFVYKTEVMPTLTANAGLIAFHKPSYLSDPEMTLASSFPTDYDFCDQNASYVLGMSVPPVMMAQVSSRVIEYLLHKE